MKGNEMVSSSLDGASPTKAMDAFMVPSLNTIFERLWDRAHSVHVSILNFSSANAWAREGSPVSGVLGGGGALLAGGGIFESVTGGAAGPDAVISRGLDCVSMGLGADTTPRVAVSTRRSVGTVSGTEGICGDPVG
jgi:hypothetical protein